MSRNLALWIGWLTGPIVFAIDLLLSYGVVSVTEAAQRGQHVWLHAASVVAIVLTLAAGALAWREHRVAEGDRERFMAVGGVAMSAFFAVVLLARAVPALMLRMGQ